MHLSMKDFKEIIGGGKLMMLKNNLLLQPLQKKKEKIKMIRIIKLALAKEVLLCQDTAPTEEWDLANRKKLR
jgi:hypothetical protein